MIFASFGRLIDTSWVNSVIVKRQVKGDKEVLENEDKYLFQDW